MFKKSIKIKVLAFLSLGLMVSCYKTVTMTGAAALTIVNAIPDNQILYPNFAARSADGKTPVPLTFYATAAKIRRGGSGEFGSYSGTLYLSLSQSTDTMTSIWNGSLSLPIGSIQTLFLAGDTTKVDTLLTTDAIPYYPSTDTSAGVRFVNLSTGSGPMSVNLQGNPGTQTEFSNLGYLQASVFKAYPAGDSVQNAGYNFEIRDQATDSVLTTYTWYCYLQKSMTIVLYGSESTGLNIFTVNNF
jgi:hypothetical protein